MKANASRTPENKVLSVFKALDESYGPLDRLPTERPLDVLVRTILSQNTSDLNSGAAFASLRRRYPRWRDVMNADPRALAAVIRSGGLANIKAARIKETLRTIREREGKLSLAGLNKRSTSQAMLYLTSLPGVGVKTACCVLLFAFGRPVMPVDTHVSRIARRLGWVATRTPINDIHTHLERIIPGRLILPMHLFMIQHGRKVCRPLNPGCPTCPIVAWCAFSRKKLARDSP